VKLTGTQSSAVVKTVNLGSGRFDSVATGQDRGVMFQKSVHLIVITTVVIHVFRHDVRICSRCLGLDKLGKVSKCWSDGQGGKPIYDAVTDALGNPKSGGIFWWRIT
jgi:hypothetical protein